jgi:RIO-like serine/threonine protein kinase
MEKEIYKKYIQSFDVNLLDCKLLGKGHNGIVFMLPEGFIIKICFDAKSCQDEYTILNKIGENKFFPRVYGMMGNYMIRDYVAGIPLKEYIKKYGLNRNLSIKMIDLIEEFKRLGFSKLDVRSKDIMVGPEGNLMVIDPKKCYSKKRNFPRHLSKGLDKLGVLDYFMLVVEEERPSLYKKWNRKIQDYIKERREEYGK